MHGTVQVLIAISRWPRGVKRALGVIVGLTSGFMVATVLSSSEGVALGAFVAVFTSVAIGTW